MSRSPPKQRRHLKKKSQPLILILAQAIFSAGCGAAFSARTKAH